MLLGVSGRNICHDYCDVSFSGLFLKKWVDEVFVWLIYKDFVFENLCIGD